MSRTRQSCLQVMRNLQLRGGRGHGRWQGGAASDDECSLTESGMSERASERDNESESERDVHRCVCVSYVCVCLTMWSRWRGVEGGVAYKPYLLQLPPAACTAIVAHIWASPRRQ